MIKTAACGVPLAAQRGSGGRPPCVLGVGALLTSGALVLSSCTARPSAPVPRTGVLRAADVTLVRFSSCGDALRNLRAAASNTVGPGGFAISAGAVAGSSAGTASQGPGRAAPGGAVPAGAPAAAR